LQHGQHIGPVGQQLGIARCQCNGAHIGCVGLGKVLQRGVRARQHVPVLSPRRLAGRRVVQPLGHGAHHVFYRLHGHGVVPVGRRQQRGLRVAQLQVQRHGQRGQAQAQQHGGLG